MGTTASVWIVQEFRDSQAVIPAKAGIAPALALALAMRLGRELLPFLHNQAKSQSQSDSRVRGNDDLKHFQGWKPAISPTIQPSPYSGMLWFSTASEPESRAAHPAAPAAVPDPDRWCGRFGVVCDGDGHADAGDDDGDGSR